MQDEAQPPTIPKILVSMCVVGHPVRYNGSAKTAAHVALERWQREGRLVPVCPELAGGFSVPRPPAEIAGGASGQQVLSGAARIVDVNGTDVTAPFVAGAQTALALARTHGCRFAILADGSPSCGSMFIHDGSFGNRRHAGAGVTAALLREHGIEVFADTEIDALEARLRELSQAG
ncbi:Purine nucleoside phosphorylase [Burkholderia cepacia]